MIPENPCRDVDDEEAWIREKEPVVTSSNRGKDLFGAQNLVKKHALANHMAVTPLTNQEIITSILLSAKNALVHADDFKEKFVSTLKACC